ncbi:TPA: M15 family metallopeptidase [Streptococcus suis]|nr:M15 family metallopeptidase [Streptococcus suis]
MKKRIGLLVPLFIFLVACRQGTGTNSQASSTVATSSNSQTSSTVASSSNSQTSSTQEQVDAKFSESSSSVDSNSQSASNTETTIENGTANTGATFNGSYYSVQGKYSEIIIANKKHPLSPSYAPGENPQALAAFQQLIADMQAQGFAISNNYSGFRSYETQAGLYQSYVNQDGQAAADTYSARAGYSEHQTGLAFDLLDSSGNLLEEPTASQWLASNAHHYGFIVRYLPGKEYSTGYMAETWHVRYIGQEATDIYNSGLTLEEYLGVPGGGYE